MLGGGRAPRRHPSHTVCGVRRDPSSETRRGGGDARPCPLTRFANPEKYAWHLTHDKISTALLLPNQLSSPLLPPPPPPPSFHPSVHSILHAILILAPPPVHIRIIRVMCTDERRFIAVSAHAEFKIPTVLGAAATARQTIRFCIIFRGAITRRAYEVHAGPLHAPLSAPFRKFYSSTRKKRQREGVLNLMPSTMHN